jgi:hypothetical protein
VNVGTFFAILRSGTAAQGGQPITEQRGVIGVIHHATSGWFAGTAMGVALLFCMAFLAGCAPSAPGPAAESFKKEVQATEASLAPSLMDAVASREPRSASSILERQCALAGKSGRPFSCGITVLDPHGIALASATLAPGEPIKRLNYSRYEVVMKALKERKIVKAKLYLQDRTTLCVVVIPLVRQGEALGLLVLAFAAADLRDRFGLTEEEFLRVDLNG